MDLNKSKNSIHVCVYCLGYTLIGYNCWLPSPTRMFGIMAHLCDVYGVKVKVTGCRRVVSLWLQGNHVCWHFGQARVFRPIVFAVRWWQLLAAVKDCQCVAGFISENNQSKVIWQWLHWILSAPLIYDGQHFFTLRSCGGLGPQSNSLVFFRPPRVSIPNRTLICSAVLQCTCHGIIDCNSLHLIALMQPNSNSNKTLF